MIKFVLALLLLSAARLALAEPKLTPIYQISEAQGSFLQVPLTREVYRYSQQANLDDLVIIDAEHNPLPWRLVKEERLPEEILTPATQQALAFYPVAAEALRDAVHTLRATEVVVQGEQVRITTRENVSGSANNANSNSQPDFYLIDVRPLNLAISHLNVDWDAQPSNQYLEVKLEGTQNLQEWTLLQRATLVNIIQQQPPLKHNHIQLNSAKNEYQFLRLSVVRGGENVHITAITAEQKAATTQRPQKPQQSWKISGARAKNQTSVVAPKAQTTPDPVNAWEYTRDDSTPIECVAIDMGEIIYGDGVKIFSRAQANQNWQLHYRGIWFQAQVGAQWQTSEALNLPRNSDKFWRLELSAATNPNLRPQLIFTWSPALLQIIANTKMPFMLAMGGDRNTQYPREQIFNQILAASQTEIAASQNAASVTGLNASATEVEASATGIKWISAELIPLNVSPAAPAAPKINWPRGLFWLSLILAVAVLLVFSFKLFKQLDHAREN